MKPTRSEDDAVAGEVVLREVILLMTPDRAAAFGRKVERLQREYGTRSFVDTIERAVDEALIDE